LRWVGTSFFDAEFKQAESDFPQQVSTASSFRWICNRRSGTLETKPSYGFAHRGDQQNSDNDGYGVPSSLHRPE